MPEPQANAISAPDAADLEFDVIVIGGGPAGATAAAELAARGRRVALVDRGGRIKPCGGAIPPALIEQFAIPDSLLVARVTAARMVAPSGRQVDMPIDGGFVGMVDREHFDEWLRERAAGAGATRILGDFDRVERVDMGAVRDAPTLRVHLRDDAGGATVLRTRALIGADGARSSVARQCIAGAGRTRYVFAYHEIIRTPSEDSDFDGARCDVYYHGHISPDFYGWIFPHGATTSVGSGSAGRGFSVRRAVDRLRGASGLSAAVTLRREGAPIPLRPLPCWDNGRDIVLAGDAAGVVAPASGEGIYYAMDGGRLAAEATDEFLASADPRCLARARRRFMKRHRRVFWILAVMERFWYSSDRRRERFVSICRDPDVQRLTWQAYMHKCLVRTRPWVQVRIFLKDLAHLLGVVRT